VCSKFAAQEKKKFPASLSRRGKVAAKSRGKFAANFAAQKLKFCHQFAA
jgi:hypothetical protein